MSDQIKFIQNKNAYSVNADTLELIDFIRGIPKNSLITELCAGHGLISMALERKYDVNQIHSYEINKNAISTFKKNIILNNFKKIKIYEKDIKNIDLKKNKEVFDIVVVNPPYYKKKSGKLPTNDFEKIAKFEIKINMSQIFQISKIILKKDGEFYFCYPNERINEVKENSNNYEFKINEIYKKKYSNKIVNFFKLKKI